MSVANSNELERLLFRNITFFCSRLIRSSQQQTTEAVVDVLGDQIQNAMDSYSNAAVMNSLLANLQALSSRSLAGGLMIRPAGR